MTEYLIGTDHDPYLNLAMEHALGREVTKERIILFFWQNENTIVVGRNQDVQKECKVGAFIDEDGRIARRRSGGGAVYHDLGNLNISIISTETAVERVRYHDIIIDVLRSFGIEANYNGRNDILVNEKKISGSAYYADGDIVYQHASLLVCVDRNKISRFLTPDISKMARNHVSSVSSRIINLCEVDGSIGIGNIINAFVKEMKAIPFSGYDHNRDIEKLRTFYSSEEWVFGGKK